jgi:RimJ/RimL family protein N-acetyltransferase
MQLCCIETPQIFRIWDVCNRQVEMNTFFQKIRTLYLERLHVKWQYACTNFQQCVYFKLVKFFKNIRWLQRFFATRFIALRRQASLTNIIQHISCGINKLSERGFIMIELQYFERSHINQLINWINTPKFLLQWGWPHFSFPLNEHQIENYIKNANKDNSDTFVYSVIHKDTGNVIGHISLGQLDKKNKSARVEKVLVGDENLRGQGIGQLIMKEILKVAFDEFKLHRVSLGVFDFNLSAIACYEKVGFIKEGLHRDSRKIGDEYWSLWEMSILENEWIETKK